MGNTIKKQDFIKEFNKDHGVIDLNNMSSDLQDALKKAGVKEDELKSVAGPDGQIKGLTEFGKLYDLVDRFEGPKPDDSFQKFVDPKATTPVPTASKELYDAMNQEITKNRTEARYAQPGTKKIPKQPELTAAKNGLVVPEKDRKTQVRLGVVGKNQFDFENGNEACFKAAAHQCSKFNEKEHGKNAPTLNDNANQAIQVAYAEDKNGRVQVDKDQMKLGHAYIDNALDHNYPVNVGVSDDNNFHDNYDKITDHFITIFARGYDDKGRLYYDFKDPGNGGKEGRLYVDKDTGKFFKEPGKNPNSGYVADRPWEMTHVMTYKNWPY
jgi:hypothetical protein